MPLATAHPADSQEKSRLENTKKRTTRQEAERHVVIEKFTLSLLLCNTWPLRHATVQKDHP